MVCALLSVLCVYRLLTFCIAMCCRAAPCLWYAFLMQVFCTQGSPLLVGIFRIALPLMFLTEGIGHHCLLLELNGSERLAMAFALSSFKTQEYVRPLYLLTLSLTVLAAVSTIGASALVQWAIFLVALLVIQSSPHEQQHTGLVTGSGAGGAAVAGASSAALLAQHQAAAAAAAYNGGLRARGSSVGQKHTANGNGYAGASASATHKSSGASLPALNSSAMSALSAQLPASAPYTGDPSALLPSAPINQLPPEAMSADANPRRRGKYDRHAKGRRGGR